jgi:dipeptidyl aminopeptidase/acylaminoacyl peptidase
MGHSYGGYATLALLVQTTRFKAAIVSAGFGNLVGAYGQMRPDGTHWSMSWAEESQGRMGGTLWEHRQRYVENSPLFYLDRATTPVLVVHGDRDDAVAPHLGDELFMALRRLNRRVEYAKYLGEPHVILGWANSVDYASRMIAWFERHLKPAVSSAQ